MGTVAPHAHHTGVDESKRGGGRGQGSGVQEGPVVLVLMPLLTPPDRRFSLRSSQNAQYVPPTGTNMAESPRGPVVPQPSRLCHDNHASPGGNTSLQRPPGRQLCARRSPSLPSPPRLRPRLTDLQPPSTPGIPWKQARPLKRPHVPRSATTGVIPALRPRGTCRRICTWPPSCSHRLVQAGADPGQVGSEEPPALSPAVGGADGLRCGGSGTHRAERERKAPTWRERVMPSVCGRPRGEPARTPPPALRGGALNLVLATATPPQHGGAHHEGRGGPYQDSDGRCLTTLPRLTLIRDQQR